MNATGGTADAGCGAPDVTGGGAADVTGGGAAGIVRVVTSGVFTLCGETWDVDNNVWVVGDDRECLIIDAAHDVDLILGAVGGRRVTAIVCTHGHSDHVNVAPALSQRTGAPVLLHPDDRVLWDMSHSTRAPDAALRDGESVTAGGAVLRVLHTPGHSPGSCCLYAPELEAVFTGDTLFQGGPGATGRPYSSAEQIVASIRTRLLVLPPDTTVYTGHGSSTTIATEAA